MTATETSQQRSSRELDKQFANSRQYHDNLSGQRGILITVEAIKPQHNWIGTNTMANGTNIFLVTNSVETNPVAFSNIGSALEFVNDSHADLNPEGAALMLDGKPASSKVVKAAHSNTLRLTATNADAAATVAKIQSTLDGAIQACMLVGINPSNVAKVAELRENLELAQDNVGSIDNSVDFTISRVVLHKRKHNKRS
tara:strand:+ start:138 stop:731 length:594 start_codon:yes stop_codon:yes gene_type:complete